ncbi:MAG: hypothetical protein IPO92_04480 [Saprospiraceae bacterium]|nr:hypothetical protein [Saprospiraceae bacterium]
MSRIVLCLFFIIHLASGSSQDAVYSFKNFGEKDGLSSRTIYAIDQDKLGFMWFGTANGLYRFDGMTFKNSKVMLIPMKNRLILFYFR